MTAVVWQLNILDIVAIILATMSILVTIWLAYHAKKISDHAELIHDHLTRQII